MAVAEKYRIPHSQLLDWSRPDREKAVWWHLRQAEACPSCGTRAEEWDPKRGGDRNAYSAVLHRCRGCEVSGRTEDSEEFKKAGRGVSVQLRRNREV